MDTRYSLTPADRETWGRVWHQIRWKRKVRLVKQREHGNMTTVKEFWEEEG